MEDFEKNEDNSTVEPLKIWRPKHKAPRRSSLLYIQIYICWIIARWGFVVLVMFFLADGMNLHQSVVQGSSVTITCRVIYLSPRVTAIISIK